MSGTLQGYEASAIFNDLFPEKGIQDEYVTTIATNHFNPQLMNSLRIIPLLSSATITGVENVTIIDTAAFDDFTDNISNPSEIFSKLQQYHNVTINIRQGMSLFGADNSTFQITCDDTFAISGFMEFPINQSTTIPVIGILCESSSFISYEGTHALIYPSSESTKVTLTNSDGDELFNNAGTGIFLYLSGANIQIRDQSHFHLYPVSKDSISTQMKLQMQPAENQQADIGTLLPLLDELEFGNENISFPVDFLNNSFFENLIPTVSQITNGGMILINYSSLHLNNDEMNTKSLLFTRGSDIEIQIYNLKEEQMIVTGNGHVFFLGDHFYTPQASSENQGIFIPILPIIFWIFALCFFIAKRYYQMPQINEIADTKLKRYGLIIHIISLIITFILVDLIISSYFGISFINSLTNQSFILITIGFLGFQLLLWIIGYLTCSLPLNYIFKTILRFTGLDKTRKAISKTISTPIGILIFTGFYTMLLLNIFLYFINPSIPTFPL
jgi:hypothetical protein